MAAMLVVLFHMAGMFGLEKYFGVRTFDHFFSWGDSGVDFFFVLSGYIITAAHSRDINNPTAFVEYARRRVLRIYPSYWVIFIGVSLLMLTSPTLQETLPTEVAVWLQGLLLIPQDPMIVGATGAPVLFVAWSLQYEVMFYAFFGLLILNGWLAGVMAALLLAAQIGCRWQGECGFPQTFFAADSLPLFAMGVAAAYWPQLGWRSLRPRRLALLGIGMFLMLGLTELIIGRDWGSLNRRLAYGVAAVVIIVGVVQAEREGVIKVGESLLTRIGAASYALYLLHVPVIAVLCKLTTHGVLDGDVPAAIAFPLIFVASIVAALAYARWVERPMLSFLGRHTRPATEGFGVPVVK